MEFLFRINPELDVPIYRQMADAIRLAVKRGELPPGSQLPTVQRMADMVGVARGTIKHAYDRLEAEGIVEKVQGRGTFICFRPEDSGSRKEQAMALIENCLERLDEMGFSQSEIGIFLDLKLRERQYHEVRIKVAVLECNHESLSQLMEQLHRIPQIDLYSYLVKDIEEYPYQLEEDLDLVVTTRSHAALLERIISDKRRIVRVALRMEQECLADIIKLRKGKKVGILAYSSRFAGLLYETCENYAENVVLTEPQIFSEISDLEEYLNGKQVLLVPRNFEKYCSEEAAVLLNEFDGQLIECSYELDEGSFMYLREKTKRLLEGKK